MAGGALGGMRVLDVGELVSGPYCARLFADQGADVVKVELPAGDPARRWGPFRGDVPGPDAGGLFQFLNAGKRGVALDWTTPDGRDRLLELARRADAVVENHAPGRMASSGLGFDALAEANPQLVLISVTPFGQTGPYASWRGCDLNAFHLSGAGSRYCGRPGEAPLEHGTFSADFFGAAAAAAWGLAAVVGRDAAGGGQHLDVSCAEAIAATFTGGQNIGAFAQDRVFDRRTGVGMSLRAPATILPCRDGHVWILALETGQWNGLVRAMGSPEWAQVELFQDGSERARNAELIYPLIQEWTEQHGKFEIMERCQAEGVPVTAVFTVAEAARHPHLRERGYVTEVDHPTLGRVPALGPPFRLPACPARAPTPAPRLGQHTGEVLAEVRTPAAPRLGEHNDEVSAEARASAAARAAAARGAEARVAPGARPLAGLRVANFGWVWAGPVAGQTLGFLGAEVWKVESRARVDMLRTLPPFAGGEPGPDRSLSNHACWAGNGSVTLNLKRPEARELALELVARCDVVIENFGPGVMEGLGLGYEALRAVRPGLVMLSMPAAGLTGPLRSIRTYGLSLASTAGLDSLTGYHGGPPVPFENAFCDPFNGIFAAFAVIAALRHRDRSGEGQHVDYSQQEAVMQMTAPAFMDFALNGRVAGPLGNRHPLGAAAPHGVFPCAGEDRWISIAAQDDAQWRGLRRALGEPAWAAAPELDGLAGRLARTAELNERLAAWTARHDDRALAAELQRHGVAAAPVLNVADLHADPHWRARGTFVEVEHPLGFRETIYGAYVKTSRTKAHVRPGPAVGQDNEHVFLDLLGLAPERYHALVDAQVIW